MSAKLAFITVQASNHAVRRLYEVLSLSRSIGTGCLSPDHNPVIRGLQLVQTYRQRT